MRCDLSQTKWMDLYRTAWSHLWFEEECDVTVTVSAHTVLFPCICDVLTCIHICCVAVPCTYIAACCTVYITWWKLGSLEYIHSFFCMCNRTAFKKCLTACGVSAHLHHIPELSVTFRMRVYRRFCNIYMRFVVHSHVRLWFFSMLYFFKRTWNHHKLCN